MSEDQALALTGTLGAMTLVVASLMVRRLPMRLMFRLGLIWLAIFILAIALVGLIPSLNARFT